MDDCVFCKIVKREIPAAIIHEDELSLAFLDVNPVNFGHTLLIPKDHHRAMVNVPDELLGELYKTAKRLMLAVREGTKADYVALSVVGVDVPHFHIHLIPRFFNDGLAGFWPTKKYDDDNLNKFAEQIRARVI
jgi:histidine triad (HIT) family protein